ncbi:hypothetical protein MetexDRAFT_2901 [Methylorubrum extorquens DSM 13060]|jgi:hypothetical protein|uniref:Uncharacterized protein n=1 Tax=Methylorubrum extorquens DSM 13060 TaxID=882800 RepID=H1KJT9_METEX|nr:hypothetical protein MetexDRAFT_2901 [Methylorubrum extorquens DSM 13060]MCP1543049.1 hypothetical protein [Methylorubrum extorquens]MCP1589606.1 hypothetical protein [Methylorubrum extorquens]BDL38460.1 hypothetical protein MSPGM_10500 [Methylorubrum sp. GM97]
MLRDGTVRQRGTDPEVDSAPNCEPERCTHFCDLR